MEKYEGEKDVNKVQRLAKQGDKDALYEMVWRLDQSDLMPPEHRGNQVERSAWQKYWFKKAADAGHSIATCRYAKNMYGYKPGFDPEYQQEAMRYFQRMVDDFDSGKLITKEEKEWGESAKLMLGIMLCEGYHTPRDAKKGVKLINEAKEHNKKGFENYGFNPLRELGDLFSTGLADPGKLEEPTLDHLVQALAYYEKALKAFDPQKNKQEIFDYVKRIRDNTENWIKKVKEQEGGVLIFENTVVNREKYAENRRRENMKTSDIVRSQIEADKAAFKRLSQRLALKGWDKIPTASKETRQYVAGISSGVEEKMKKEKYEKLVYHLKTARTEDELRKLCKEFSKLNEYADSRRLANDCLETVNFMAEQERNKQKRIEEQRREKQYQYLLAKKRIAFSETEYNLLAKEFRALQGYKDAASFAAECEKLAAAAKGDAYEKLLQSKKQADEKTVPNVEEYCFLARQFREMGSNYKEAAIISDECELIALAQERKNKYDDLLERKRKAQSEDDFRILANDFIAMGDYKDTALLAEECKTRYEGLKNERIHTEYTHSLATMKRLKKSRTRKPYKLRNLAKEWEKLSRDFMIHAEYQNASALAQECNIKSGKTNAKANKIEKWNEKTPRFIGRILQTGVFVSFLYVLFWTDIVSGSARSISLAKNVSNAVDIMRLLLPFFLPFFIYSLAIGYIGSLFITKKKRRNFLFCLAAIIIQAISVVIWTKESFRDLQMLLTAIVILMIPLALITIPGVIIGVMKRKTATITLIVFLSVSFGASYGFINGWFDFYGNKKGYEDGMAAVPYGNFISRKWGFVDESGKEVIPCIYTDVQNFSEGLAAVKKNHNDNSKWGFIDKEGNEIVPFKYEAADSFSEGMAKVRTGNEENGLWGFVEKSGKEVIPCKYDFAYPFSEGLAAVRSNGKWGFVNKSGNVIISFKYDVVHSFIDDYAQVGERANTGVRGWNFHRGLIDRRGNVIIPCKYSKIDAFNGDLAIVYKEKNETRVGSNNYSYTVETRLTGVVNKSGHEVISPDKYYDITIRENFIEVKTERNANIQYYDKEGNKVRR